MDFAAIDSIELFSFTVWLFVETLTIFKVKKYSIYKMMVNVTDMEILPDDSFGNGSSDVNTQDDSDQTF